MNDRFATPQTPVGRAANAGYVVVAFRERTFLDDLTDIGWLDDAVKPIQAQRNLARYGQYLDGDRRYVVPGHAVSQETVHAQQA